MEGLHESPGDHRLPRNHTSCQLAATPRGSGPWARLVLTIVPPAVALAAALWHGPFLIDDAYITLRYAGNLAAGHGLVFNHGEAVLGTSTPLLTLLLGLFELGGVNGPFAARLLGLVGVMLVVLVMQRLALPILGPLGAAAAGVCLALHPGLAFAANSGMETAMSMAAVYGTLLAALGRRRYALAGLGGGAAFLLRPDGLLVVLVTLALALVRDRQRSRRLLVTTVIVVLPWLIYAAVSYGAVLPNSIPVKQFIHPDRPLRILMGTLQHLTFGPAMKVLFGLAVVGLVSAAVRKAEILWIALWILLYVAGLSAACIAPIFPWYVTPLAPGLVLFAGYGVASVTMLRGVRRRSSSAQGSVAVAPVLVVLLLTAGLCVRDASTWRAVHEEGLGRVGAYLQLGDLLRERCAPGDVLLVGEVGALAYALPEQFIVDSSGINSPEAYEARKEDRARLRAAGVRYPSPEGSPVWVLALIARYEPDYIVTYRRWLHIQKLMRIPAIEQAYRRVDFGVTGLDDYFVLEKRSGATFVMPGPFLRAPPQ